MSISKKDLEDIKLSLRNYPELSFHESPEPYIEGDWKVSFNGELIQTYQIKITFPKDYPRQIPLVYELSEKIPKHADRHLNGPDWNACLFVADERWEIWPMGSSFQKFLEVPIYNFFLLQAYYEEFGEAPPSLGERKHREEGIIEYYYEKFKVKRPDEAGRLILATRYTTKRTERCPCGKNESFGTCHYEIVKQFRDKADPELLGKAAAIFLAKVKELNSELKLKNQARLDEAFQTSPLKILK
jgi:hypothetical protein